MDMRRSSRISTGVGQNGSSTRGGGGGTIAGGGGGGGGGGVDASSSRVSRSAARQAQAVGSTVAAAAPVEGRGTKRKATTVGASTGSKSVGAHKGKGKAEVESDADDDGDSTTDDGERAPPKKKRVMQSKGQKRQAEVPKGAEGKGKAVASPSETSSSEEDEEEPTVKAKKPRKLMKGKSADWREFEKPTTLTFDKLPLEVWNQIIRVDSDLDLRDHIALAGTCRYLRSCYTDLIWHILFAAHAPDVGHLDYRDISISSRRGYTDLSSYVDDARVTKWTIWYGQTGDYQVGPHRRSWAAARGIVTSGMAERAAGSQWGATREEWEAGKPERLAQTQETKAAVIATSGPRFRTYYREKGKVEVMPGSFDFAVIDELTEGEKERYPEHASDERQAVRRTRRQQKQEAFEAFPSPWRDLVVKAVNEPTLASSLIKYCFKLTSNEVKQLLSLAAVQSFALKLHGGVTGHADFLLKTKQKSEKAQETERQNYYLALDAAAAEAQSAQSSNAGADALPPGVDGFDDDEMDRD